jgi:Flp pilus assembly protein TadG
MKLDRIVKRFRTTAARFARAERGNVAMMFAVMLPLLLTSLGAAIDYSRAANARSAMQAAADAAALMVSKEATGLTPAQLTTKATDYFKALYSHPEVGSVGVTATYSANSGTGASVVINASGSMQTDFMKLAGHPTVALNVSATTRWGNIRYRVALALDNTGSMAQAGKIGELKTAATKLINDFYAMAATNEDVYISIVPFAKDVNIGSSKKNESWMDFESGGSCSGWGGSSYKTKTACENAGRTWTNVSKSSWNGCVMDRSEPEDTTNTTPASGATRIPAEQYDSCPQQMLGMTSVKASKQTLLDKIDDMMPDGGTNQVIGLFWAWMTHATSGPFPTPSKNSSYVYQDVIILLTDGLNTQNRIYGNGMNPSPEVDARQKLLCSNARTQGIKIFAIQVATDGDPIAPETKNCTTEPNNSNYFSYITDAQQMSVKFENIFKELARLRVSS